MCTGIVLQRTLDLAIFALELIGYICWMGSSVSELYGVCDLSWAHIALMGTGVKLGTQTLQRLKPATQLHSLADPTYRVSPYALGLR